MNEDEIKKHALEIKYRFKSGLIDYGEAKKELQPYKDLYNKRAEEIAAKYNQKPQRFRIGDFLKS